jgi:resuscitation-promoting factor RpfB
VYVDGKLAGKTVLTSTIVVKPVAQVEKVGTKPRTPATPGAPPVSPGTAQAIGKKLAAARGWGNDQYDCLYQLWAHESGWRVNASNPSGAYGIPQAKPGEKMAAYGADWATNPTTQIQWGLAYIAGRYVNPCGAWSSWQANGWY